MHLDFMWLMAAVRLVCSLHANSSSASHALPTSRVNYWAKAKACVKLRVSDITVHVKELVSFAPSNHIKFFHTAMTTPLLIHLQASTNATGGLGRCCMSGMRTFAKVCNIVSSRGICTFKSSQPLWWSRGRSGIWNLNERDRGQSREPHHAEGAERMMTEMGMATESRDG